MFNDLKLNYELRKIRFGPQYPSRQGEPQVLEGGIQDLLVATRWGQDRSYEGSVFKVEVVSTLSS